MGNYLKEQILNDCSEEKSVVTGRKWKGLSKNYLNYKERVSSSDKANMELFGDMLDALEFKPTRDGIEIGIFDDKQAQKADNHNKFSSASTKTPLPKRQFIPNAKENETFRSKVLEQVKEIINDLEKSSGNKEQD